MKANWSVQLRFDSNGVGNLVSGHGHTTMDGKVTGAYQIVGGQYILEMKDGQVSGWHAHGTSYWNGCELAGKTQSWSAGPTGPTTSWIQHKTH